MQKRWILVLAIVIFLAAYGLWPDLNKAVNGGVAYILGESWIGLTAFGGSIAANPFYQQFHMLIWFAGGIVFTYAIMRIHLRQRIAQKIHGGAIVQRPLQGAPEPLPPQPIPARQQPAELIIRTEPAPPREVKEEKPAEVKA